MYAFNRFEIIRWANTTATPGDSIRLTIDDQFTFATVATVTPGKSVPTIIVSLDDGSTREIVGDLFNNLTDYNVTAIKF